MSPTDAPQRAADRTPILAALMAGPAIAVALGLCTIEAWRYLRPRSPLFVTPFAYTLADAITTGDLPRAYQFIRAGQDPNGLIAVRHPVLTGGRAVFASPLIWAAATQKAEAAQMLLAFGARMDHAANAGALCLAEALRHEDVVRVLRAHDGATPLDPCPPLETGEAPLLRRWR